MRCSKAMGLRKLPSQDWQVDRAWMLACAIAAGLDAWTRLFGLHDIDGLAAEPDTMRGGLHRLPAKPARHACRCWLTLSRGLP
ncbi:hypothetical protein [Streptomyces sp. NPDC001380]|uniref:hypothetical protein n=1 Tax=Streptomyces sp. NPDC001380 TaxID=3364566 RepID=UPI0036B12E5A